ncbi:MAG: hypothetical protein Rhirs2KO_16730 [Rhizobiaceae bacterium]
MIANWVKVLWILIGGTAAAAGAAYVGGVFDKPEPGSAPVEAAVQQKPAGQTGTGKEATGEAVTTEADASAGETGEKEEQVASLPPSDAATETEAAAPAGGEPAAAAPADGAEPAVPVFDLVRVEPDGSVVIAGNAAPGSVVELIAGASVIGTATAGDTGDFAVVLDDPLKPGDYTVVLRATSGDNLVASSTQTAVIAVPESENGQVLALVEEPGQPSRLITVPSVPTPAEPAAEATETAAAETVSEEKPQENAVAENVGSAEQPAKPETTLAGDTQVAEAADAEAAKPEENTEVAAATDNATATETDAGTTAAATDSGSATATAAAETDSDTSAAPAENQAVAALDTQEEPAEPAKPVVTAPARIAVEAVEIEGRDVFVAGRSEAGSTVRVYANDILLGQAVASEAGRFLIEAERDLPVGDYIVRADMLKTGTADVVARAAVPFEREPGENVAAVAPPQPASAPAAQEETAQASAEGADDTMAKPATEAAAAESASGDTAKPEEKQVAALEGDAAASSDTAADGSTMQAAVSTDTGTDASANNAAEATAPKLESVGGAVIIRRGDTLWRLSRRVYGRGVRYTTIYLANQNQIADPDKIWPGQVFSVPSETDEGEEADMSAVAEQMADPDEGSGEVVTR